MSQAAQDWKRRAELALRSGRLDEGEAAYRELLGLVPDDADAWFNLGYLLRANRKFEGAVEAYRAALANGVARPEEAHLNLAVALSEHCNDASGAERELQAAIAANEHFLPAWLNLGNLREDLGDMAGAEAAYRGALAVDPACGRAHGRLAMIACHRGEAAAAAGQLETLLRSRVVVRGNDQAEVFFALGHALDASGDYDRAFQAIGQANRLRGSGSGYDPKAVERMIDAIIAGGSARLSAAPQDGLDPLFICGLFRSGSTLAEVLIERRLGIAAGGELEAVPAIAQELGLPMRRRLADLDQGDLATSRARYGAEVLRIHPAGGAVVDKRCDNFLHIGLIKAMLPGAKIVHTRRDLRDTVLSQWFGNFDDSMSYTFSLETAAHWARQYQRLMRHWDEVFAADILALDYERLVAEPDAAVGELAQFVGRSAQTEGGAQPERAIKTLSSWQVRQPVHQRSAARWRNYRKQLEPVARMLELA